MHKKSVWLISAMIVLGIASILLLVLTVIKVPIGSGLAFNTTEIEKPGMWSILGNLLIVLLMLFVPTSHITFLIMAGIWLNRAAASTPGTHLCPHCGHRGIYAGWLACPYCGEKLPSKPNI